MSIYSNVLRKREDIDTQLVKSADEALINGSANPAGTDRLENTKTAVREILRRFNIRSGEARCCETTEELLDAMLDPENIMYEKIDINDTFWKKQANLILAFLDNGTPIVLAPSVIGYSYFDPTSGRKGRVCKKLKMLSEAYIIFRPLGSGVFSLMSFLKLLVHLVTPGDIPAIAAATLAVSLLGLVAPNVNKQVLTRVVEIGEGAIPYLLASGAVFVLAGLAKGAFSIIKTLLLGRMKQRISAQMQTAIMAKLLLMPYSFFGNLGTGKLSNQVRNGSRLTEMIITFVMNNLLSVVFSLVYIPQMYKLAPVLVVPAVILIVVQMLLSVILTAASAKHMENKMALRQNYDSFLYEALKGMQKIQNMGAQKRAYARVADNYRKSLSAELNPPLYVLLNEKIVSAVSMSASVIMLLIAAISEIPQPDYIAFTSSYALIASSITSLVGMCNSIVTMRPLLGQMKELFDCAETEKGVEYVNKLKGEIELKELCFSYDKSEHGCIDNISLHIRPGEKVAFVGESGCGKSTLLKLLLGMIEPDSGLVIYDGKPLATLNKRSLRKRIASVFQFTRVFPGTIYDNICFTSGDIGEAAAWKAAEQAAIADDIRELPLGMETDISEGNGGGFSGGQKQRLMLARAFAQKPSVLILDEATSALDNIAQKKVLDSVYKMKCTVLMVAHRLSTVIDCDRIIMLQNGVIAEQGDYETLIKNNGPFAELVRKQQISEANDAQHTKGKKK